MNNAISTVQEAVDRLIADPNYAIDVAVGNNYPAIMANYQAKRMSNDVLTPAKLIQRLQLMRGGGFSTEVDEITNVPWIPGGNDLLDHAYIRLEEEMDSTEGEEARAKASADDEGSGFLFGGLAAGLTALSSMVGMFGAGTRAREASEAEQERLYILSAMQDNENMAKDARLKSTLKMVGIGVAVVAAIVVLVLFLRRKHGAA